MIKTTVVSLLLLFFPNWLLAQSIKLKPGIKINRSVKLKKKTWLLTPGNMDPAAVIVIEGNGITIDFGQSTLQGNTDIMNPDRFTGIAIEIRNSRNVTIRNLVVKGYKVGLIARNVEGLVIENSDFSYNYRPRLQSTQQQEDISDWLSYHHNDKDEWLRYGAGIYMVNCNKAKISKCRITGNQNALLMRDCSEAMITNNDFSFNSGLGIGLYRCSCNNILYNRIVFNIRGYSHGVYQRGQDSAGILAFEQCSNNLFYKNNVTHGGDGFFLWAGQTTMDSGKGGCNDNILLSNDFSYAATNGIELTFSRNTVSRNRIFECENGIWAGYSYHTNINNNRFRNNKTAIAIEHGQDNSISYNLFDQDKQALRLWADANEPAGWGYARARDTKSRNYTIVSNSFNRNPVVLNLAATAGLNVFSNTYAGYETLYKMDESVTGLDTTMYYDLIEKLENDSLPPVPGVADAIDPFKGSSSLAGRKNIRITDWGPYDYNYPIIWQSNPADSSGWMEFDVLGPKGNWLVRSKKGLDSLSDNKGNIPGSFRAKKGKGVANKDIALDLEYSGAAFTTAFGEKIAAGRKYPFRFRQFFQPLNWEVLWYPMDTAYHNPLREQNLFAPTVRMAPVKKDSVQELNYAWWGGLKVDDRTFPQFITIANARIEKAGDFELSVTWQGAVRVMVGDKLVLDAWKLEKEGGDSGRNRRISVHLNEGQYIRVEHLGFEDFSALSVKLLPGR